MGGISVTQLIIIAVIVILLFGTKKLRGLGGDLGSAIKGFKKAISDEDKDASIAEKKAEEASLTDSKDDNQVSSKVESKEKDQA